VRLRSAASKLFGLEDDEVLIEGLQGGVGETGGAVENSSANPLESGAAWKAVEDGLLVETAGVEVWVA